MAIIKDLQTQKTAICFGCTNHRKINMNVYLEKTRIKRKARLSPRALTKYTHSIKHDCM